MVRTAEVSVAGEGLVRVALALTPVRRRLGVRARPAAADNSSKAARHAAPGPSAPRAPPSVVNCNTTQYNTTQYNAIQHNTTQYNTTQYNATQCNTTQYTEIQCNAIVALGPGAPRAPAAVVNCNTTQ